MSQASAFQAPIAVIHSSPVLQGLWHSAFQMRKLRLHDWQASILVENKTTVYKVPVSFFMATLSSTQGLWEMVSPFHLAPTRSTYNSGEVQVIHSLPVGTLAVGRVYPLQTNGRSKEEICSQAAFPAQL